MVSTRRDRLPSCLSLIGVPLVHATSRYYVTAFHILKKNMKVGDTVLFAKHNILCESRVKINMLW